VTGPFSFVASSIQLKFDKKLFRLSRRQRRRFADYQFFKVWNGDAIAHYRGSKNSGLGDSF